jgi:hypothetical protein
MRTFSFLEYLAKATHESMSYAPLDNDVSSPQVIALQFPKGDVLVGCGYETRFGDRDGIIARSRETADLHSGIVSLHKEEKRTACPRA